MIDVGAAGETDSQLRTVLHLSSNAATLAPAYAALACADESAGDTNGQELLLANSIWAQQDKSFESAFLATLTNGYQAPLELVDFASNASGATDAINLWVSQQTQGQIPSLLQPGDLSSSSQLVLVNAVYFKGTWDSGFDASNTSLRPFTLEDQTQIMVTTMSGVANVAASASSTFELVELPYKGGRLAMDFILPSSGTLAALEATLTGEALAAARPAPPQQATLFLPKFAFQTRLELTTLLAGMGMPDLFDASQANLSGMDGATDLFVDTVVQQATVEVDESGTVATAATAGDTSNAEFSGGPPMIMIDHPFVFLIRDTANGNILFIGQVEDPRQ